MLIDLSSELIVLSNWLVAELRAGKELASYAANLLDNQYADCLFHYLSSS